MLTHLVLWEDLRFPIAAETLTDGFVDAYAFMAHLQDLVGHALACQLTAATEVARLVPEP